jgi:formate/nitrite transporter FocA (FNT family)
VKNFMKGGRRMILAGFCIGIGATVYLSVDGPVGALLFALGLMTIICFEFKLFTGKAGLLANASISPVELGKIWIGNFIGTGVCAFLLGLTPVGEKLRLLAQQIVETRNAQNIFENMILGLFCGVLMYVAVTGFKMSGNYLFIYIPVATFILSRFNHCVADMFYIWLSAERISDFLSLIPTTIGNICGCNLIPLFKRLDNYYNK